MITLTELCEELRNWNFNISLPDVPKYRGTFTISDGEIDLSAMAASGYLQSGQYFRIIGSHFNDGVYRYPASGLAGGLTTTGAITIGSTTLTEMQLQSLLALLS